MRFLSTKAHGVLDYLVGIILIAAPWIFGFAKGGAETWIFVVLGVSAIVYSLLTDYELGAAKFIAMPVHLTIDLLSGIFLAGSPWIFGFSDYTYVPHLVFGLLEIGASLITRKQPGYRTSVAMDKH